MNEYKFGKGVLAVAKNGNSISVSRLDTPHKLGAPIVSQLRDTIELKFTSVRSVDKMIADLQDIRKNMMKVKFKQLMGEMK